jgi:hypothetical protein
LKCPQVYRNFLSFSFDLFVGSFILGIEMPLARIITDSVDESLELTMQLRSRGFQVETVPPGQIPGTPADLEVVLEECDSSDVLTRTAQAEESDDLWVFVAPGALDENARPMRAIPLIPQVIRLPEKPAAVVHPKEGSAVTPVAIPEDDPILLELFDLSQHGGGEVGAKLRPGNGNGGHGGVIESSVGAPVPVVELPALAPKNGMKHVRAAEVAAPSAEVFVFPTAPAMRPPLPAEKASLPARANEAIEPVGAEFTFWRLASLIVTLAIAALLIGMNLSQKPLPVSTPQNVSAKVTLPPRTAQKIRLAGKPVVSAAKPVPGTAVKSPTHSAVAPAKTISLDKTQTRPTARASHDEVIAEDTVRYFDRNGRPAVHKPATQSGGKHRSDSR